MDLHDELKSILSNSSIDHTWLQGFDQLFSANYFYTSIFGIRNSACTAEILQRVVEFCGKKYYNKIFVLVSNNFMFMLFTRSQSQFFLAPKDSGQGVGKREDMLKCKKK